MTGDVAIVWRRPNHILRRVGLETRGLCLRPGWFRLVAVWNLQVSFAAKNENNRGFGTTSLLTTRWWPFFRRVGTQNPALDRCIAHFTAPACTAYPTHSSLLPCAQFSTRAFVAWGIRLYLCATIVSSASGTREPHHLCAVVSCRAPTQLRSFLSSLTVLAFLFSLDLLTARSVAAYM